MAATHELKGRSCSKQGTAGLPSRFWMAINLGILTEAQAHAEWARQQAQGNPLNLRESDSTHA